MLSSTLSFTCFYESDIIYERFQRKLFFRFKGDNSESVAAKPPHRQKLREESQASFELLKQKNMDGLLIACKQVANLCFHLHLKPVVVSANSILTVT